MRADSHRMGFKRSCWAIGLASALTIISMLCYPGGTARDHTTAGYSLQNNFLSDLGMTAAYNGQRSIVSAVLFIASLILVLVSMQQGLFGIIGLFKGERVARWFARAAGASGLLACAAFVGVASTPENLAMDWHVRLTMLAFRILPAVPLFLALAAFTSSIFPQRVVALWACLAVFLAAYIVLLQWNRQLPTAGTFTLMVLAQKIVTVVAIGVFLYQLLEAERALARTRSASAQPR